MAIRIPPPKTPTDGTLLTSARNVADEWYQPLPPKQAPQWRLWVNLPAVELWQAITLSCDIEPKYYLGDADPEFQLRMRIAIGNGLGKGERPHCALVTLTDVARLARRCGWTLPPEFPQPVAEQPSIAGVKPSPEEVEHGDGGVVATPAAEQPAGADDGAQALSKAEEILAKERGKPRDIAWAWTVLMDHRQGVAPEHNERRYRQILERHRWILALPVLTTDERGCPTRQYGGTPVSGIDRNSDPEDRLFMRVMEVRDEAVRQGLVWPDEPSAPDGGVGSGGLSSVGESEIEESVVQVSHSKPLQRHRHQEEEILQAIRDAGFDPARLPERKAGHRGVKAFIRSKFTYSKPVFDKAWERLRAAKEIAEES